MFRQGLSVYGPRAQKLLDGYAHLQELCDSTPELLEAELSAACARHASRCAHCGAADCPKDGRWFRRVRIPAKAWFVAIKAFEVGLDGRRTAALAGLSNPTVYRAFNTLRLSLARGEAPGRGTGVFGVKLADGLVRVSELERPDGDSPAQIVHKNGFVCTAAHSGYESLLWHSQERQGVPKVVKAGRREPRTAFVKFLIGQAGKHRGIPLETFGLYVKEYEFRFNHRGQPLFDRLVEAVTARVPA